MEMSVKSVSIVFLLVCATTAKNLTSNNAIGFPESEENPDLKNSDDRKPVYIPSMCPINELYYPGDQKNDWICDCRPAFLYHPSSDMCWPAYQRGPCAIEHYLILPQTSVIPICTKNPCKVDGFVPWNGNCAKLGSSAPCNYMNPVPAVIGVNSSSLVISCVRLSAESRFGDLVELGGCPPGCKRSITGKCIKIST